MKRADGVFGLRGILRAMDATERQKITLTETVMRKNKSAISMLPGHIREEINRQMYDGWRLHTIRKWLFAQKADRDIPDLDLKAGDFYELYWARSGKNRERVEINCFVTLYKWQHKGYPEWLVEYKAEYKQEKKQQEASLRLIERVERLGSAANEKGQPGSIDGANVFVRALLMEAMQLLQEGKNDPDKIARLAHAWARMNHATTESEKFKLANQKAIDLGWDELKKEVIAHPEAVELLRKMHAIVKGEEKKAEAGTAAQP